MKSELIKLYENSKGSNSFFSQLNSPKRIELKNEFNRIFEKTVYFKDLKIAKQQALYNILHDINEIPIYSDGSLKIFKNLKDGYYSEEEYNSNKCPIYASKIKDKKYLIPVLFHIKEGNTNALNIKNNLIVEALKDIFKEDYDIIPHNHIFNYLAAKQTHALKCRICRRFNNTS